MRLKGIFTTSSKITDDNYHLKYFALLWTIVLLLPLVYYPLPSVLFGHPWKVELVTSLLLALMLACLLFKIQNHKNLTPLSPTIISWIIIPCCLLIFWSGMSAFWAGSTLSVIHHTLLWFCYLIFFLFAIQIVSNRKLFALSIFSLSAVIGIIATLCIIEFTFATQITEVFGFRYARFAEMHASVLPLFFSFILRFKKKHLIWAILMTVLVWLAILFSLSRGALLSSVVGLSVFILIRILTRQTIAEKKRLILATAGIILIAGLVQIPFFSSSEQSQSMLARLNVQSDKDPGNSIQKNIRLLFNRVGLEMFTNNVLRGVGADNFGLEFNKYRASFSAKIENKAVAEQKEEILPERAHNEYLQILAELGLVGGALFAWFILGIARLEFITLKSDKLLASDVLNHAAIAGIIAFLCSSLFSSFSFRLMQNGLVFFFLLAILLRHSVIKRNQVNTPHTTPPNRLAPIFVSIAIVLCLSLTMFSVLKATSLFFTYQAEREADFDIAKSYFERAEMLDPANASANFFFGIRLRDENQFQESCAQLKGSVAKGLNTMGFYSHLTTSQILANDFKAAEKTTSEAVKIFPYSVFARARYGFMLKKLNMENESAEQYEIAKQLNKKQALTWWLLINEGALVAIEKAKSDSEILSLDKLNPNEAIFAVLTEREILHPEKKIKFEINNKLY
jgi:O-antigen ligase